MAGGSPNDNELFARSDRAVAETLRLLAWRVTIADNMAAVLLRFAYGNALAAEAQCQAEVAREHLYEAQQRATARGRSEEQRRAAD